MVWLLLIPRSHSSKKKKNLKTTLMHPHGTEVIVLRPRHEPLAQALIDDENDLGRDLRAEKACLLRAGVLPLGKILGDLGALDVGGRLRVPVSAAAAACAVGVLLLLLREDGVGGGVGGLLLLLIILLQLLGVARWRQMVGSGGGGEKKGIYARAMSVRCAGGGAVGLGLRRVGAGGNGSG